MKLTELECGILDHLRRLGGEPVRIRDLHISVNESRSHQGKPPYAYTTVATVVQNLDRKGAVESAGGRGAGYRPVQTKDSQVAGQMREVWAQAADADAAILQFLAGLDEERRARVERALTFTWESSDSSPARVGEHLAAERPARALTAPPVPPDGGGLPEEAQHDPNMLLGRLLEDQLKELGITKRQLAEHIGCVEKTIINRLARPTALSPESLEELVEALEMPDAMRAAVFRLAGRIAPPKMAVDARHSLDMPGYRAYLDGIRHPSVLYDITWNVVYANRPYRELFAPGRHIPQCVGAMPLDNGLRYIFWHPRAFEVLGGGRHDVFHRYWRTLALAHFAAVYQGNPDNSQMKLMLREIKKRPNVHLAYQSAATWIREHGDVAVSAEPRPFFDQRTEQLTEVQVLTETHGGVHGPLQHATFVFPYLVERGRVIPVPDTGR